MSEQNQREISQNKREMNQNSRDAESDYFKEGSIRERASLSAKLDDLKEDIAEFKDINKEDHTKIIAQTTTTNGKVAEIIKWKERMTGALIVLQIIILPIIFFLLFERLKYHN